VSGTFHRPPRAVLALIGICILAATLYWAGSGAVLDAIKRCHPGAVAIAAAAIVTATILGAWNVYRIAGLRSTMTFLQFLPVFWRSWAVGITLPGQVADMLTMLWQLKGRSGDLSFVAGRLLADKAITLGFMLVMASLVPLVLGRAHLLASVFLFAGVGISAATALASASWCVRHPDFLAHWRWGARVQPVLVAANVPIGLALGNAVVTLAKTLLSGLAYWVVFRSLDTHVPGFATTTVISQGVGLVAYLPISFNGLGTVEVSAVALFRAAGLQSAVVLSAYLILRATTLATAWLPAAWWTMRKPSPMNH
jgi:uncharacterized membrane protein YbhN (UPF0104 family)